MPQRITGDSVFALLCPCVFLRGVIGGLDMTVERIDKESDSKLLKLAPVGMDNDSAGEDQPDEQKEPLEFASMRLRKKLMVRRAIRESRPPRDGASRDIPRS